jgi:predicted heme/steroid binding protein
MKRHIHKKRRYLLASAVAVLVIGIVFGYKYLNKSECQKVRETNAIYQNLPTITQSELSKHDGIHNPTIYIAFNCIVYDVTEGKNEYYGEGTAYHYLVARDATKQLKIFGGDIIESKYPPVGILEL